MRINNNNYSIAELLEMLARRELIINRDYQRGSGLWPSGARSYFVDTILEDYPFPKLYMYEFMDRDASRLKKELVDGQQRLLTIRDFAEGKFRLSGDTGYAGKRFHDLDDDQKQNFMTYVVSVDVIRNATRGEILQMFRRMNAYTLPLNEAEKRHSSYYGDFKWFINNISDEINEFLVEFKVFTSRQIVRMADAELLTDCVLAMERGLVSTSPSDLRAVYKKYDDVYEQQNSVGNKIIDAVRFIAADLEPLRGTHMMKPYALHSLLTGLIHARHRIPALETQVSGSFGNSYCLDAEQAAQNLLELAQAHEAKETDGPHALYVWGCLAGTNRLGRRAARLIEILSALGFDDVKLTDDEIAGLLPS